MNEFVHDYLIHGQTMVLEPIRFANGFRGTRVIEEEQELLVKQSALDIINYSCLRYGSTFKGRKDATIRLIHINRKPPIAVCTNNEYYFFPSSAPTQDYCIWFSKSHIAFFKKTAYNQSEITFINGKRYPFHVSKNILEVQLSRTTLLKSVLHKNFVHQEKAVHKHPNELEGTRIAEDAALF